MPHPAQVPLEACPKCGTKSPNCPLPDDGRCPYDESVPSSDGGQQG